MTKISTQFQLTIDFQQFVVATTGRRGGEQNIRHLERKHEVKEAHVVEEQSA